MKGLYVHGGVLCLAAVLAASVWTKEDEAKKPNAAQVEVWNGSVEALESISFESATRKVRLEAKKDERGRYYVGSVEKDETKPPPGHPGVDATSPAGETKHESIRFVGVKAADEYATKVASLMALRSVGKIEGNRAEEFGLDKPEGTLKVKVGGREHALVIGGGTPGGQERYAKLQENGAVYAVPGDLAQGMLYAESRLIERELHGFNDSEPTKVRIAKGAKSRETVRLPDKKEGWADVASPTKLDETIGNYMTKVNRLRVMDYVEKPAAPLKPEDAVLRIDYFVGTKAVGFLELFKVPGEKGSDYLARTEQGRWYVKVLASAAEQVEQDLPGLLK